MSVRQLCARRVSPGSRQVGDLEAKIDDRIADDQNRHARSIRPGEAALEAICTAMAMCHRLDFAFGLPGQGRARRWTRSATISASPSCRLQGSRVEESLFGVVIADNDRRITRGEHRRQIPGGDLGLDQASRCSRNRSSGLSVGIGQDLDPNAGASGKGVRARGSDVAFLPAHGRRHGRAGPRPRASPSDRQCSPCRPSCRGRCRSSADRRSEPSPCGRRRCHWWGR